MSGGLWVDARIRATPPMCCRFRCGMLRMDFLRSMTVEGAIETLAWNCGREDRRAGLTDGQHSLATDDPVLPRADDVPTLCPQGGTQTMSSAQEIGSVKSSSGKSYKVKWDPKAGDVYVSYAGWAKCGQAKSAGDAMRIAEAYLYNK